MAKYEKPQAKGDTSTKGEGRDFIREALQRFDDSAADPLRLRERAIDDYRFAMVPGHQWDAYMTGKRRKRPCYEFNRLRQMIRRVTGQQLQNRPRIKVRPAEGGDVETAEIYNGIIRNIEAVSRAKIAYDHAFTWATAGGRGAWEITSDYESEKSFDKGLRLCWIPDPFSVLFDPTAKEFDKRDARYSFVSHLIPRTEFERLYPGKAVVDFSAMPGTNIDRHWWYQDEVRIAKYWFKETEKRVIYRLSDGTVVDAVEFDDIAPMAAQDGLTIAETRELDCEIVKCCLISGRDRLTEVTTWPGKFIPVVINWGELVVVDGDEYYSGMTRFGRDAQKIHNFELSTLVEVVAKMPNSPLTATTKMIEGLQSYYERLGYDDPPVLLYNVDPGSPNARPTREPAANFPAAFAQVSALAVDEIKATTGIYDASLGARSNETSGRAILARQQEADVSNYVFIDNHIKALEYTGEILVDLIPKVIDGTRMLRILGEDGAEKFVSVNKPVPATERGRQIAALAASGQIKITSEMLSQLLQSGDVRLLNDLSRGSYDVVVSTGRSFETQRMEVAEAAEAMARTPGPFGMLAQYLLFKNLDVPGMDEFLAACRRVLVAQGLLEPSEDDPPAPPPQPNPKDVADAELKAAQAQKTLAQTQQIVATTPAQIEKTRAETAESVTRIGQAMPDVPIGDSIFGPAPGSPPPAAPQ